MRNPSSSSYQVLLSFHTEKKSSVLLDHQFFLSFKQQQQTARDYYISSQKSPQTRNALKTESTYSRIITTCDAARIFFVYILLRISSRDSIKSMLSLSRCIFSSLCLWFLSLSLVFFVFFASFSSAVHLDRQFLSHQDSSRYLHTHTHISKQHLRTRINK